MIGELAHAASLRNPSSLMASDVLLMLQRKFFFVEGFLLGKTESRKKKKQAPQKVPGKISQC